MRYSSTILLLCATLAIAAPSGEWKKDDIKGYDGEEYKEEYNEEWKGKKEDYKEEYPEEWKEDEMDDEWKKHEKLFYFDAYVKAKATPDQVIANNGSAVFGQPSAKGIFKYGLNIPENTICYNITLSGVTGNYSSPAVTATHIHEGVKGRPGPPRIALPNPTGPDNRRTSYGCLKGPFITGIISNVTGVDTGVGFHVRQIAANPSGFFTDTHTVTYPAGAVRGQLSEFKVKNW